MTCVSEGIFYQLYDGRDSDDSWFLAKATREVREATQSDSFHATMLLVVTWDRVQQGRYRAADFKPDQVTSQNNTGG